jgi:hypothetical protein
MSEERIALALSRIDAALTRVENAGEKAAENAGSGVKSGENSGDSGSGPINAKLVSRHEALRERVSETLADLDKLIGKLER